MKKTKYFDIEVPELGDIPDITQVSDAISGLEDALAGTVEYMTGTVVGDLLTLTSETRATKRTNYHDGMAFLFTAQSESAIGAIKKIKVDDLEPQLATQEFLLNRGDTALVCYNETTSTFYFNYASIPKSNEINSNSTVTVGTSYAVKITNDRINDLESELKTDFENLSSSKTDNGGYTGTSKDLANLIVATQNLCPYGIGDILTTTLADNPATKWVGTTWAKIEGRYLKGSKGSEVSKTTGGSNTKNLTVDQMPSHGHSGSGSTGASGKHTHTANHGHTGTASAHTHTANHNHTASQVAHAHTQPAHTHTLNTDRNDSNNDHRVGSLYGHVGNGYTPRYTGLGGWIGSQGGENTGSATPAITVNTTNVTTSSATPTITINNTNVTTSEIADHTHTVSVSIGATGGGKAIDIQPEYYIVHHWLRTA